MSRFAKLNSVGRALPDKKRCPSVRRKSVQSRQYQWRRRANLMRINQVIQRRRTNCLYFLVWFAITGPVCSVSAGGGSESRVLDIGSRLELFVDRFLIDKLDRLSLRMHSPRPAEKVLFFDKPWEGTGSYYVTVFKDDDRYRMYYRGAGYRHRDRELTHQLTCYAESQDGIRWTKPELGLIEFAGSKKNNIVWDGVGTHNFAPFKDTRPYCKPDEKYKALAGMKRDGGLFACKSPDGIHWSLICEKPVITQGAFDSQNLAFWSELEQQYVSYFRVNSKGFRAIGRCSSKNFRTWTDPVEIDTGNAPREHFYTNATTPYFRAPHIYFSFPKRFYPQRKAIADYKQSGVSDGIMMTSRNGVRFDRTFLEAFVRPGRHPNNWTDRNNSAAWGVVPTGPDEISMYYLQHYKHPSAHMRRMVLRTDGFVSVHADGRKGELITKPFRFQGKELVVNYATSAAGSLRVELQDVSGKPVSGHSMDKSVELYGDEIRRVVRWKDGSDVSKLAGTPVRLRVVLRDADLYSIRFRP